MKPFNSVVNQLPSLELILWLSSVQGKVTYLPTFSLRGLVTNTVKRFVVSDRAVNDSSNLQ